MVKQFKETQMEGRRLLHLGIAACMLMLVMVICHAEPVFAKNFEMDLDANKVTYTLTEANQVSVTGLSVVTYIPTRITLSVSFFTTNVSGFCPI